MPRKPALPAELVHEFDNVAHSDLSRVEVLLEKEPAIVNASWDWGGGDWETGLGAAAHMGRRDIALRVLDAGARIDIFAAAMLGRLDIVTAIVAADPGVVHAKGPHDVALLTHARKGGKDAIDVVSFLLDRTTTRGRKARTTAGGRATTARRPSGATKRAGSRNA